MLTAKPGIGYDAKALEWNRKLLGTFVPPESPATEASHPGVKQQIKGSSSPPPIKTDE
jgi:hypothetical protein